MRRAVLLTAAAERDLAAIHEYIATERSERAAYRIFERMLDLSQRLSESPERGRHPRELLALGIREYRQVMMPPHRILYRIIDDSVVVVLIADARRNMQSLLARRLLDA